MTIDALHIIAVVIIFLALWKLIELHLFDKNPESKVARAMLLVH